MCRAVAVPMESIQIAVIGKQVIVEVVIDGRDCRTTDQAYVRIATDIDIVLCNQTGHVRFRENAGTLLLSAHGEEVVVNGVVLLVKSVSPHPYSVTTLRIRRAVNERIVEDRKAVGCSL